MMKNVTKKVLSTLFGLVFSISMSAYDSEVDRIYVDGLYYEVVSYTDLTCKVVRGDYEEYTGDIVIPATINYANKTLSVTIIDESAFRYCSGLTSLTIPNSVVTIENSAFAYCSELTDLTIGNSVTKIGAYAFENCSGLTNLTIPNSVITIGDIAFYECSGLTNLTIGNSVTEIGAYAFENCSGLTSLTIPNSVTTIKNNAFEGCRNLSHVTIGSSVTKIGSFVFRDCEALTVLYSLNTTPPTLSFDAFTIDQYRTFYMTLNVYVPQEALEAYQTADLWKNFWNLQGFDATGIGNIKAENENANVYFDLRGNRLDAPKHGVNIINGKKVIMK